jgi:hypothetical protein
VKAKFPTPLTGPVSSLTDTHATINETAFEYGPGTAHLLGVSYRTGVELSALIRDGRVIEVALSSVPNVLACRLTTCPARLGK